MSLATFKIIACNVLSEHEVMFTYKFWTCTAPQIKNVLYAPMSTLLEEFSLSRQEEICTCRVHSQNSVPAVVFCHNSKRGHFCSLLYLRVTLRISVCADHVTVFKVFGDFTTDIFIL